MKTNIKLLVLNIENLYFNIKINKEFISNKLRHIYDHITNIMSHIQLCYNYKIISKNIYNINIDTLESTFEMYKFILKESKNIKLYNYKIKNINKSIAELEKNISTIINQNGYNNILEYINYLFDINIYKEYSLYKNILNFYNNFFITQNFKYEIQNRNIKNIKILLKKRPKNTNISLIEKLEGATIIYYIKSYKITLIGIFKKDPLNITRLNGSLEQKYKNILEQIQIINSTPEFKNRYLEQISLRDFVLYSEPEILNIIEDSYNDLLLFKHKPLSELIKEFMNSSIEKQRYILTLFVISDSEDQFLAHVISDILENNNSELKDRYDDIYFTMHRSIQKLFKNALINIENQKILYNISDTDISYEKRIHLMKTSDSIKKKAYDKLKDIKGSKDNSVKAHQYLDGILQIPFNIYKKEAIMCFIDKYIVLLNQKKEYISNNINKINNINLINIIKIYLNSSSDLKTDQSINIYISSLVYILNDIGKYITKNINPNINKLNKEDLINILNIDNINNINNIINNEYDIIDETDCIIDNIDEVKDENLNNLMSSIKIPHLTQIKDYMNKVKNIQNLKNILIDNNNITPNTIELMNDRINEIKTEIGIPNIEYISPILNDENSYNEINSEENNFIKIFYNIIFDLIYKWIHYKKEKITYIKDINKILNKCIYGHLTAKKQISRLIGQWINGKMTGGCIGFCGPPGVGKTTLCKNGLSKCLINEDGTTRPFAFVPLGGSSNGPLLEGHHYTYLGSTWGKIVDILINTKCMNPIIYIDEIDKVSKTEQGKEIISILTHITDPTQNMEFNDRYFAGVPIDLSKVLFIFSYNDSSLVDSILKDRIHEIQIKALTRNEKMKITKDYILPEILEIVGFNNTDIILKKHEIEYLIDNYTFEAGVRKLYEHILIIIREINLELITDNLKLPYLITIDYIKNIFNDKQEIKIKKIASKPHIGIVNGLYATNTSVGGLTIIEVLKSPSDRNYSLYLTGQQGDVMKESMHCAKTLAWNLLPITIKKKIKTDWEKNGKWGLHIHCPEGSTPKDGPSAGCAITIAILSRLCEVSVNNKIALTGEIDLNGNVCEVGGIISKIEGAIKAGVSIILLPKNNEEDYKKYLEKQQESMSSSSDSLDSLNVNDIEIKLVSRIEEIIEIIFTNKIEYSKLT